MLNGIRVKCHYTLNVIMHIVVCSVDFAQVIMPSAIIRNNTKLNVVLLSDTMLSAIMLIVIMLNVWRMYDKSSHELS
jgi:hypothetical protein